MKQSIFLRQENKKRMLTFEFPSVYSTLYDIKSNTKFFVLVRGKVSDVTENIRYWEYNSTFLYNGQSVDISNRHPVSKQLTMEKDAEIINNYKNPTYVLSGWTPTINPIKEPMSSSNP